MDFDIYNIGSDFLLTEDKAQDVELLLDSKQGSWYQFPEIGIDIKFFLNGSIEKIRLERLIREQLKLCGIEKVDFSITKEGDKYKINFYETK